MHIFSVATGILLLNGNATSNVDFFPFPHDVHFSSGQQETTRDITIFDDNLFERKEVFIARLTSPKGGVIQEPSEAVITINDDEGGHFDFKLYSTIIYTN